MFDPHLDPHVAIEQPPEVFISYSRRDSARIEPVQLLLASLGVSFWIDHHDVEGSQFFPSEITKAIKQSRLVILMCSEAAQRSRNVRQELMLAWQYERPCLPLLLEHITLNDQLEYFLAGIQWIEVYDSPTNEWMPRLCRTLESVGIKVSPNAIEQHEMDTLKPQTTQLQSLRALARFNDSIWPFLMPEFAGYRDLGRVPTKQRVYSIGAHLGIAIKADRAGHLLLLDEGTAGTTYCLCPSRFAQDTRIEAGLNYLPQFQAYHPFFEVSGKPGREELLAIISDQPFPQDWMPRAGGPPARILNPQDVELVLAHLQSLNPQSWIALATYFDIAR